MTGDCCVFKFFRSSVDEKHSMRFQIKTSGLACVLTVFEQFDGVMKTGKRDKDRQSREELGLLKPPSNAGYLRFRIGPLQDTVTWPYGIMGRKLHSRPLIQRKVGLD